MLNVGRGSGSSPPTTTPPTQPTDPSIPNLSARLQRFGLLRNPCENCTLHAGVGRNHTRTAQVGYTLGTRVRLAVDLFNILDSRASDIDYYYASRLPGEPVGGVTDIHAHPTLPRTARVNLILGF